MNATKKEFDKKNKLHNPDPTTKVQSSHLVGTGVGAVAGGAATGAAVGTVAGPAGTIAGAAVGAVVGGLAGHSVAKAVNPSVEDAYWRENHRRQSYAKGRPYDDYGPAYRTGYEGYAQYGANGCTFEDREMDLQKSYEATQPKLAWDEARPASHAAWQRFQEQPPKRSKAA
jgi:uncharacterized protein YcfJ